MVWFYLEFDEWAGLRKSLSFSKIVFAKTKLFNTE